MSLQIENTLFDVRAQAAELLLALPKITDIARIEAGVKCLGISYVSMVGSMADLALALSVLEYVVNKASEREMDLRFAEDEKNPERIADKISDRVG